MHFCCTCKQQDLCDYLCQVYEKKKIQNCFTAQMQPLINPETRNINLRVTCCLKFLSQVSNENSTTRLIRHLSLFNNSLFYCC